jgi:hypothetical protein
MSINISKNELKSSFMRLSYEEWLAIPEPIFFNFAAVQEENYWMFLEHADFLLDYSTQVTLLKTGEKLYKLDGKQRKIVWESGKIEPPEQLTAQIFNMAEADFEILNMDARTKQIEMLPSNEVVKLYYNELSLDFRSERFRHGFIAEALNITLRGRQRALQDRRTDREKEEIDIKKAIQVLTQELTLLDNMKIDKDIFVTGVLSGVLVMLGLNKPIEEFLLCLNERRGKEEGGMCDPIASLLKSITGYKKTALPKTSIDLCKKTIQAIDCWIEGADSPKYWRKVELRGIDHMPFIHELKRIKNISEQTEL